MHEWDDIALLREYVERDSGEAFAQIVARHVNKVYSTALRHTGNPHSAEEITQAVFVILAKKSRHLSRRVILSGWLYQTARLTAVTFIRSEIRRARREQEAHMQTIADENESDAWTQIAPLLDAGMATLNETDRHAVVLRYFDGKSMSEVGAALDVNEDAAKKRVNRALEKLRKFFMKRGVSSTTAIIAGAISANSVQAAPMALAKSVLTVAVAKGAVAGVSTLTLTKAALKLMAWTKVKTAVAIGIVIVAGAGSVIVKNEFFPSEPSYQGRRLSEWLAEIANPQSEETHDKAREAIRHMGVKTLPFLLANLAAEKQANDDLYRQAILAFNALGPIARPAIPKLTNLLEQNPGYVPLALADIGPDAMPEILNALTNANGSFWVRDNAAAALANAIHSGKITPEEAKDSFPVAIHNLTYTNNNSLLQNNTRHRAASLLNALKLEPDISVPALIRGLENSNFSVAAECARALGGFGKSAKPAIPVLSAAASSTNNYLSSAATMSLYAITNAP